jgi:hypothetical protein
MSNSYYFTKYLKYKQKYLSLIGGAKSSDLEIKFVPWGKKV